MRFRVVMFLAISSSSSPKQGFTKVKAHGVKLVGFFYDMLQIYDRKTVTSIPPQTH